MFQFTKVSTVSVILVCALAAGCVSRPVYDESWAERVKVKSGSCPVIDGEYLNAGEQGLKEKDKAKCEACASSARSLARMLSVGNDFSVPEGEVRSAPSIDDPATYRYQSIRLQLTDDNLQVEASLADGGVEKYELPIQKKCRNSTLVLHVSWDGTDVMGSVPFVSFINHAALALGRAQDGSLLVRNSSTEGLFLLEWPLILVSDGTWTRFAPSTPAPEQLSAVTP